MFLDGRFCNALADGNRHMLSCRLVGQPEAGTIVGHVGIVWLQTGRGFEMQPDASVQRRCRDLPHERRTGR
jgi:hypothetical protein